MRRSLLALALLCGMGVTAFMVWWTLSPPPVEMPPSAPLAATLPERPEAPPLPAPPGAIEDPGAEGEGPGEEKAGSGVVTGHVRDQATADGIEGAEVVVRRKRWMGKAVTEVGGAFRVEGVPAGEVTVQARSAIHMDSDRRSVELATGEEVVLDFDLSRGAAVVGRVTERGSGDSVEGAKVYVQQARHKSAVTDSRGTYRIEGLSPGNFLLAAESPDHPLVRSSFGISEALSEVTKDLVLVRGAVIRGMVRDARGGVLAEAKVSIRGPGPSQTQSGPDGRFELRKVPPERSVYLTAEHADYASARSDALRLKPGEILEGLLLEMPFGARLRGRILLADGAPAPEAWVRIYPMNPRARAGRSPSAKSGADGTFELFPVAPGDHRLTVTCKGALRVTMDVRGVEEGGLREGIEVVLGRAERIEGVVVDTAGQPVARALVMAQPVERRSGVRWGSVRADAEGRFQLEGLVEGRYRLTARLPRGGRPTDPVEIHTGEKGVRLRLPTPGVISGRVVLANGEPVTKYRIRARPEDRRNGSHANANVSNEQGEFRLTGVAPGTYVLSASGADGFTDPFPGVAVSEGQEARGLVLTMGPAGSIRGRVVSGGGDPVSGARVMALPTAGSRGSPSRSVTSGSGGEFILSGLAPGPYRVFASFEGVQSLMEEVAVLSGAESTLEVRLPGTGRLVVRVRDVSGAPVVGAWIRVRTADGRGVAGRPPAPPPNLSATERADWRRQAMTSANRTNASGVFIRDGVPEGEISVSVTVPNLGRGEGRTIVTRNGEAEVVVVLEGSAAIPGQERFPRERNR